MLIHVALEFLTILKFISHLKHLSSVLINLYAPLFFYVYFSRIGGTSYLFRSGIDLNKLHRSGRWMMTDTMTVDHYLKPGLYSASPAMIREKRPQYKQFFRPKRVEWLRDRVQTKGDKNHHFNEILI